MPTDGPASHPARAAAQPGARRSSFGWAAPQPADRQTSWPAPASGGFIVLGKIARSLAAVAVAGAPFVMFTAPSASAANGCSVSNTSTQTNIHVEIHIPTPPALPTVSTHWSNLTCSYITEGGRVEYSCVVTGRCEIY